MGRRRQGKRLGTQLNPNDVDGRNDVYVFLSPIICGMRHRPVKCDQMCSEGAAGVCKGESKVGRMAAGYHFASNGHARVISFVQVVPTPQGRENPVSTARRYQ